jgi:hypothetical protein
MMRDAMVFSYSDYNTFPLVYLLMVKGERPDVLMATYSGRVRPELYAERPPDSRESVVTWLIKNAGRPAYCTVERPSPVPPATFVTAGLLYYLKPPQVTFSGGGLIDGCDYRNLREPTVRDIGADLIMSHYHVFKGLDELERGDRKQGLEDLRTAARICHGMKGTLNQVGLAMLRHDAWDEAAGYFEQAAQLDPRYTEPRWHLFQMYQSQARWEDVRRQLAAIIQGDPNDARARAEMGFLLQRQFNDTQGAVDYWRAALQLDPKLTDVREALEQTENRPGG